MLQQDPSAQAAVPQAASLAELPPSCVEEAAGPCLHTSRSCQPVADQAERARVPALGVAGDSVLQVEAAKG